MFIYNASHLFIGFQDFFLCIFSSSLVFDFDVSWHRFLCVILFGYTWLLESISLCLFPTLGSFQPLFFRIFFGLHFILSFQESNDTNVRSFVTAPQVSETLLMPFLVYFLYVIQIRQFVLFYLHWFFFPSFIFVLLLSTSNDFFISVLVFFNYKISTWFFFISSISLLRLFFPLFQTCLLLLIKAFS